jgi:hypothetical protein
VEDGLSPDERAVRKLDDAWNEVYLRNERAAFANILADDFHACLLDGSTANKADLMKPTPGGAKVSFSERGIQTFTPTAVTRGRIRIEHADRTVVQHYVRVYARSKGSWRAVTAFAFPTPHDD